MTESATFRPALVFLLYECMRALWLKKSMAGVLLVLTHVSSVFMSVSNHAAKLCLA